MRRFQKSTFVILFLFFSVSCTDSRFDIDTDDIAIDYQSIRFDRAWEDSSNLDSVHQYLKLHYPHLYKVYYQDVMRLGNINEPASTGQLPQLMVDPILRDIQSTIDSTFSDDSIFPDEFETVFTRVKYYFPDIVIPKIAFYNSGFNYAVIPDSTSIGIGLEWFVGSDRAILKGLPPDKIPMYLREKMSPEYLVADAVRGWLMVNFIDRFEGKSLLDYLVFYGKLAYTMDAVFPNTEEYIKLGYMPDEVSWCEENEYEIYRAMVTDQLLHSSDGKMIQSFIGLGPFTKGFSERSPGRLAFYVGRRMVEDYMEENDTMTIATLMDVPPRPVLHDYRPRK